MKAIYKIEPDIVIEIHGVSDKGIDITFLPKEKPTQKMKVVFPRWKMNNYGNFIKQFTEEKPSLF